MKKFLGPLIGVGVVGLILFFALTDSSSIKLSEYFIGEITDVQDSDYKSGTGSVSIIEYGDFECPACGQFFPIAEQVKRELGKDVTFVFRHFPLSNIHPNAMAAHRAAEAAGLQGKFFEMHDLLYKNQSDWNRSSAPSISAALDVIEGYAELIALDMDKYRLDVESEVVRENIQVGIKSGQEVGVNSTPTIFVNGEKIKYNGGFDFEAMKTIIENAKSGKPLQAVSDQTTDAVQSTE